MNVFTFSGNLGRDCNPSNAGGTNVVNFAVAVKSGYGQNEQTLWLDCALWGKRGDALQQYLLKGQQVVVSGELGTREYEGKAYLTCRVSEVSLVGGKSQGQQQQQGGFSSQQQQQRQPVSGTNAQQPNPRAPAPSDDFDDDIPFAPVAKQYRSLLNAM